MALKMFVIRLRGFELLWVNVRQSGRRGEKHLQIENQYCQIIFKIVLDLP